MPREMTLAGPFRNFIVLLLCRAIQRSVAGELDYGGGEGPQEFRADRDPQVEDGGLRRRRLGQQRAMEFQRSASLLRHCHLNYR